MTRRITPQTTLDNLRKEAKRRLKDVRAGDSEARARLVAAHPKAPANPVLRDVQHAIAREYGFAGWTELRKALAERPASHRIADHEALAADMVSAYATGEEGAIARLRRHYNMVFTWADLRASLWSAVYKVRLAKGAPAAFQLPEAQELMARRAGFPNWNAYMQAVAQGAQPPGPPYVIDGKEHGLRPRRQFVAEDWEAALGAMREARSVSLHAGGQMTDAALAAVARLEHVTRLDLSGSRQLSDEGLQALRHMTQLEQLNLSGTNVSDRGLEVLRYLPNLHKFEMTWQKGITDAGASNLRYCEQLEEVNLMGSLTGDGVIAALRGKAKLHEFSSGTQVTNAGVAMLPEFPRFLRWNGGECRYDLMTEGEEPTYLHIDGSFTDAGVETIAKLDGISGLNLFWNVEQVTAHGIGALAAMRNLRHFRCDGKLASDEAMAHFASMPLLRMLVIQGTIATDEGFMALSKSPSLEYLWGRECPGLTGRGFSALAKLRTLRGLGVSCKRVDDSSLAALPAFPALVEFMPMDVADEGFRHVGSCERLDKLWCMYCRETGDRATEHIAGLRLSTYCAGLTQITDRSMEILGGMDSLEVVELYETKAVTDKGLAHLAKSPRLRRVELNGLPNVTHQGTQQFPRWVEVKWEV
jgi:hypothetical protein